MATPSPPRPDAVLAGLLGQALAARQAGDLAATIAILQRAAQHAPRNAQVQHDLGQAFLQAREPQSALGRFERAIGIDPGFGLAHFRRGVALEMLGRPGFAEAYENAIATAPTLAEPYACLASAREQAGRLTEALALYRQALQHATPGSTAALIYAARVGLAGNDLDAAEQALRQVLNREPHMSSARGMLARVLTARGDFTAAAAELEQGLHSNPRDVSAYYTLVQSRPLNAGDGALIARMRAALEFKVPATARLRLRLALAKGLDDLGDQAGATAELTQADRMRVESHRMDREALRQHTDHTLGLFTPSYFSRNDHQRSLSAVPILVLGLPRSGTTLTAQILACHPAIASAGEISFWDSTGAALAPALRPGQGAALAATCGDYLARLHAACGDAAHIVDKNPFNFRSAALAHLAFPNARIIHCRRHPADNALSIMMTALRLHKLFSPARDDLLFCMAEYLRLMAHVRAVLPRDRFYELDCDSLVTAPEPHIRALLDFLGLPFEPACLHPERLGAVIRTASAWQVRQPVNGNSVGRSRGYEPMLADFAALGAPPPLRRW